MELSNRSSSHKEKNVIKNSFHRRKRLHHKAEMPCTPNTENKEKLFITVMNMKKNCTWIGVSRAIT
jgi:hypothetical protein